MTRHFVHGRPIEGPFDSHLEEAVFALGCFWGAERRFWETDGVFTTAVGYAGGYTVRNYGRMGGETVDAIQVEIGLGTLVDTPRMAFIDAVKSGRHPEPCPDRLARLRACMRDVVRRLGIEAGAGAVVTA